MVPEIIDRIDSQCVFILTNALYFKGLWSEKFDKSATFPDIFHCLSGRNRNIEFMHGKVSCRYCHSDESNAALCELPFGNKAFALDILLPDDGVGFGSFVYGLDAEKWNSIVSGLCDAEEAVSVPKLDFSYSGDNAIKAALQSLGIRRIFDCDSANFGKLSTTPTFVNEIIQKTCFKMDENGAEAAAVTAVIGYDTAAGPSGEFIANRPFVLAIRETSTGAILFLGAYKGL
jgi:serpin B